MKILAIIGTKYIHGVVASMAVKVLQGAKENGHESDVIYLYNYNLQYCHACWVCKKDGKCILKDDFNDLYEKVKNADILIIAAPTYFSNVPGIMKTFFDRHCCVAIDHGKGIDFFGIRIPLDFGPKLEIENKQAIFITSCTAPSPFDFILDESRNTFRAMHHFTRKIGAHVIAKLVFTDARFLNVKGKKKKYYKKAYNLGLSLKPTKVNVSSE